MQEFLSPTDEEEGSVTNQVELKITAPNHKIISVVVHRNWTTQQVYRTVIDKVGMLTGIISVVVHRNRTTQQVYRTTQQVYRTVIDKVRMLAAISSFFPSPTTVLHYSTFLLP